MPRAEAAPAPANADTDWVVELFRGIAALLVVIAHYGPFFVGDIGPLKIAFTGVDLFFVLSGFVFAPYYFGKTLHWPAFALRRVFRIFPLYWLALAAYIGLNHAQGLPVRHVVEHFALAQTLVSPEIAFYYNPAFWSLPVELEYYLLLALLAPHIRGTSRFLTLFAAALLAHQWVIFNLPASDQSTVSTAGLLFFHLPGILIEFLLGALVWRWARRHRPSGKQRILLSALGLSALAGLGWLFRHHPQVFEHGVLRGNLSLSAAFAYGLILLACANPATAPSAKLRKTALAVGNLSYGIYLFHNLPLKLLGSTWLPNTIPSSLQATLALLGVLLLAALGYRYYENPLRQQGRRWARQLDR